MRRRGRRRARRLRRQDGPSFPTVVRRSWHSVSVAVHMDSAVDTRKEARIQHAPPRLAAPLVFCQEGGCPSAQLRCRAARWEAPVALRGTWRGMPVMLAAQWHGREAGFYVEALHGST